MKWQANGSLEFLGRQDQQVKVRGYRIELGEIEGVLEEQAGVERAVVVVEEGEEEEEGGGKELVGYVVWEEEGGKGEEGEEGGKWGEMREGMRKRLPEYMVPGRMMEMKELPLLPNGKVDRKGLPKWGSRGTGGGGGGAWGRRGEGEGEEGWRAGRAEEEIISGIYAEVLGEERVGVEESFFDLGGHSLLATQVVSRVRKSLGVELALREIFAQPTAKGLAEQVRRLRRAGAGAGEEGEEGEEEMRVSDMIVCTSSSSVGRERLYHGVSCCR